jgi:hypothetical protein
LLRWAQTALERKELTDESFAEFLGRLLTLLNGVVEVEANCKWALITLCEVIRVINSMHRDSVLAQKRIDILTKLCELDSKHHQRYFYLLELEASN